MTSATTSNYLSSLSLAHVGHINSDDSAEHNISRTENEMESPRKLSKSWAMNLHPETLLSVKHELHHQEIIPDVPDKWDGIISPILPSSSSSLGSKPILKKGSDFGGHRTRSASTETFTTPASRRYDCMHLHATPEDDVRFTSQTRSEKSLKVRTATSTEMFKTPAAKKSTRIIARDESDGTPADNMRSLSQLYRAEDSGYDSPALPMFSERPCKMGREKLDIIAELRKHEPALVDKIVSECSVEDSVRFSGVSREWRNIVEGNRAAALKKRRFILQHKPKSRKDVKENYPRHSRQRRTVSASTPLGEVQQVGEPQASSTPAPRLSNHDNFIKTSDSLLVDESLTKCARGACQSPARLLMNGQRGQCTRCGYDFCTNCHCKFHGGSPCDAFAKKNSARKSNGVGSSKSKRSLRRIARLESYP